VAASGDAALSLIHVAFNHRHSQPTTAIPANSVSDSAQYVPQPYTELPAVPLKTWPFLLIFQVSRATTLESVRQLLTVLSALEATASHTIDIVSFMPSGAIDPIYFDKAYYLGPDRRGAKP
jgi:hypothetical protein